MRRLLAAAAVIIATAAGAAEKGDDGLYKSEWMRDTFKDLREDLAEANAEGKRLMVIVEQRGCSYCKEMHEVVFPTPAVHDYLMDNYFVVQMNLHGATEVTDFDGEVLTERQAARKWGLLFTPTMMFFPEEVPGGASAEDAAVATMPGAFSASTTLDLLTWVNEDRYDDPDEDFQRYHARMIRQRGGEAGE